MPSSSVPLRPFHSLTALVMMLLAALALLAACSSDDDTSDAAPVVEAVENATDVPVEAVATTAPVIVEEVPETTQSSETTDPVEPTEAAATETPVTTISEPRSFTIEVWADNWMAVYVDGQLVGEDSVPITTERSFNAETFTFEAAYPFTIAIEAKDFKETDSGIEYIGEGNQQMGDGGIIAQITDNTTGTVVAATDANWSALVVHRAPLNTECVRDVDPDATCLFEITDSPSDWTSASFDDAAWSTATEWSEAAVSPKDGYDQIVWDASAQLIWGTDLEVDNTVLLRFTVA